MATLRGTYMHCAGHMAWADPEPAPSEVWRPTGQAAMWAVVVVGVVGATMFPCT